MSIILQPVGVLKSYCRNLLDAQQRIVLSGREGQSISAVCEEIGFPKGLISLFVVNGHPENGSYRLRSGDEIKCIAVIGGG